MLWETFSWTSVQNWGPDDWFLILAFVFGVPSFFIYWIHELKGTTKPHPLTWTLFLLTMCVATVTAYVGEGGKGVYYNVFYCFCIATVLLTSIIKDGFRWKEVEPQDVIGMSICIASIAFWVKFNNPYVALFVATGVDAYGFKLTFRKTYHRPWSETALGWGLSVPNIVFTGLAMENYNWLTLTYPIVMSIITFALVLVCLSRRRAIPRPQLQSEF